MKKFMILSLTAAMLFGASSFANAQWFRCRSCCSGGQCALPVQSEVKPCAPVAKVEPCKPVEKILEVPEYLPFCGDKIPVEPCTPAEQVEPCKPVQETATCEQSQQASGIIVKQERQCRLLAAVNRARARFGLKPCLLDASLTARARSISQANARYDSLFHSGSGTEIIATNSCGSEDYLVQQWLNSWEHRRILLGNYRYIGVGTSKRGVSIFGACQFSNNGTACGEVPQQSCETGQCAIQGRVPGQCSKSVCTTRQTCRTCTQTYSRYYIRRGWFGGYRRCCWF